MPKQKIDFKKILTEWGLTKVPVKKQEEMAGEIGQVAFRRVLLQVLPRLSKADKQKLQEILDQEKMTAEQLVNFLQSKVSDFAELLHQELMSLKEEVSNFLQTAKTTIKL